MLHCSPEASADFDSVSKLSMLEVLKQRKRRRRLTVVDEPEEGTRKGIDVACLSHQRSERIERKLRTREPLLQFDTSFEIDHGAVGISKRKRRTINPSNSRPVSWSLIFATTSLALLLGSMPDTADAFQPSRRQTRCSPLPSSFPLPMSLATPTSMNATSSSLEASIPSKNELESMKVTDLKQLIKDSGLNERGLLSKLKKKQDLVEFLAGKSQAAVLPQPTATAETTETEEISKAKQQQLPKQPKKVPLTMPKKKPATATPAAASDNPPEQQRQSPMQNLFDQVNEQYPTLQYLRDGNSTLLGELDIRQRYHPLLQAGKLQAIPESELSEEQEDDDADEGEPKLRKKGFKPALSGDMDLIFVGTASCTPSITRGVSCTALRLHSLAPSASTSKKESHHQPNYKGKGKNNQRFDVEKGQQTNLGTWLFDCGESTQLQIQKTSSVRPSKITKIFLSHAHGDHSFGLPGLLCLMGQDTAGGNESAGPNGENIRKTKDSKAPIDIYGPEGLRLWLRTAIRYSVSRIVPRYRVHELKDVAMGPEWGYSLKWEKYFFNKRAYFDLQRGTADTSEFYWGAASNKRQQALRNFRRQGQPSDWVSLCEQGAPGIERSELYGEVEGGRDIYPMYDHPLCSDGAPIWEVEHEGGDETDPETGEPLSGIKVYAGPMSHGIPCVGYVVQEAKRPGRLRSELVTPICQRNVPALKEAGFRHPMKALAVIKELPEGGSFTFPDGTVVTQEEAVEPSRPGRKVVICGDTNSARSLEKLAKDADVVVHESTNTFLPFFEHRDANPQSALKEAIFHGHSTPEIAGDFAKRVGAKRLILNHFSARYMGDQSLESMSIMTQIEQQAMKASGLTRSNVAAAWDFMIFPIPKAYHKPEADETNA